MAWNAQTTTTTQLDDSLVSEFSKLVHIAAGPNLVATQLISISQKIAGKDNSYSKYPILSIPSALTETDEITPAQLTDTDVTVTPVEEGNALIITNLSSLQTGGKIDIAGAKVVGQNMGSTVDKRALTALEGGTPVATVFPNTITAVGDLTEGDTLDRKFLNRLHNKLKRRNTPPLIGSMYALIGHPDCFSDLREDMQEFATWEMPEALRQNFLGVAGGFALFEDGNSTVTDGGGSGTVDSYHLIGLGDQVLIYNESQAPVTKITGPFDILGRFLNVGWYGVFAYGILDGNNMVHGKCASTFGANS